MTTQAAIDVRGLSRRFGDFIAVDNLSFQVKPGEIFGFLGANGAGKSTTIRMLCGLLRPTSGTALVGGVDVAKDPEARQAAHRLHVAALLALRAADRRPEHPVLRRHLRARRRALRRAPAVRPRHGRPPRPRGHADARPARRLAPASRARLRHPARAADRVPRRAHRRRRSAVAPTVLGPDRSHVRRRHHRARHHALSRRGRALPPHRHHPGRQARGAGHGHRAEAGVPRSPDPRGPGDAAGRGDGSPRCPGRCGEDQPVRHVAARGAAARGPRGRGHHATPCARLAWRFAPSAASRRRSRTCSSTWSSAPEARPSAHHHRGRHQGAAPDRPRPAHAGDPAAVPGVHAAHLRLRAQLRHPRRPAGRPGPRSQHREP